MITGYTRPLYLLPFDHRASYISGLFGWKEPLNREHLLDTRMGSVLKASGVRSPYARRRRR
jgi:hypothetical protein